MIIYGSRMYGKKNQVRSHGRCDHCRKHGTQESYDGRKWGHLYFIPLFPIGDKVRVLRECRSCNMGSHLPLHTVPQITQSTRDNIDKAIIAIGAKETHFETEEGAVNALASIANNIRDVYCLLGEDEAQVLLENLRALEAHHEVLLVEAKLAEVSGRSTEAESKFKQLADSSEDPLILFHHVQYMVDVGKTSEALPILQKVESMLVDDLSVKQLLIECYETTKQWNNLADTYENCFLIVPELMDESKIYKAYKKACKKAGRKPLKKP